MAKAHGVSEATVRRIWREHGLRPHHVSTFKVSRDPRFVEKLTDKCDTAPYDAVRPAVPFAVNQAGAPGQAASMAMDWSHVDRIDEATLNEILYAAAGKEELLRRLR